MVGTTYLQRIFTYFIALLREHLYQAYERPVRPQIYDLVAETKRTFDDLFKSTTGRRWQKELSAPVIPPKVKVADWANGSS